MHSITDVIKHLKQNLTEELSETAIAEACREAGMTWRETTLNPVMTIQIFFVQILDGNTAIEHLSHLTGMSFTAAAYCQARMRVQLEVLCTLLQRCVGKLQEETFETARWLQTASPGEELPKLVVNPHRPNRPEPRVRKRWPKQYSLMTNRDAS